MKRASSTRTEQGDMSAGLSPEVAIRTRRIRLADRRALYALLRKVVALGAVVFVLFGIVFGLTPMKGGDMQPKFAAGDLLLFYRMPEAYARNDVVVMQRDGSQYVGRIIGMPGDTIEITDAKTVRIDGSDVVETNIYFETEAYQDAVRYPLTLEAGEYFVLGDHRETAHDSRYFGPVQQGELAGKVISALCRTDI